MNESEDDTMAVQALAHDDPDLQSIREQIAAADPQLRKVLEDYMARWFQYAHQSVVV